MTRRWTLWLVALSAAGLAACSPQGETPDHLRIAVLPDQSPGLLHRQHGSLVKITVKVSKKSLLGLGAPAYEVISCERVPQ
ncbi:MAG: hypothetical protein JSU95_15200 [Betaproteobacteria bacterium]|nr:MAG: hypothetical protein JSU95_15200 [Betaproteobacteria bacterium]